MRELSDFSEEEIKGIHEDIDTMDQEDMARKWRFAPAGDILFRGDLPFYKHFQKRFASLGGMTQEISNRIGL